MRLAVFALAGTTLLDAASGLAHAQSAPCANAPAYGNDTAAGGFVKVNGISIYYESHGTGSVWSCTRRSLPAADRLML